MEQERNYTIMGTLLYGSHLYGTNIETSDRDYKEIYLPDLDHLIMNRDLLVYRDRFNSQMQRTKPHESMGDCGYETEIMPIHRLSHDWLKGQSWAIEFVFGFLQSLQNQGTVLYRLCHELRTNYLHKSIQSMAAFAMKQTFDYVHRGERLNRARNVLELIEEVRDGMPDGARLDSAYIDGKACFDAVVQHTGLAVGETENHGKKFRTLLLNGREYLETTRLDHLVQSLQALVKSYGERVQKAADDSVDLKSMMHAVRVYQQVLEYLSTGWIVFPRPNAAELLQIRNKEIPLAKVADKLSALDEQTVLALESSQLPLSDELRPQLQKHMLKLLRAQYGQP